MAPEAVVLALIGVFMVWWLLSPFQVIIVCGIALWLAYAYCPRRRRRVTKEEAQTAVKDEYDYIIVGGGPAGCVLANRLTENKKKRLHVLLLEAGHPNYDDLKFRIPASASDLPRSESDWNFSTSDEPVANRNGGVPLSCGKALGGTSAISSMLYNRGDAQDYDAWEKDFGCSGWNALTNLPFFRRSHYDQSGRHESDPKHHGKIGEWYVDNIRYLHALSSCFLDACKSAGLPSSMDFNTWKNPQEGFGAYTIATKNGERVSAAAAFLSPAMADSSRQLKVLSGAVVQRILFDHQRSAIGVEFRVGKGRHLARVRRDGEKTRGEVLLTAGALISPHLLMLSGVGPVSHLGEHGISAVCDLPSVGENLQDQPAVNVEFQCHRSPEAAPPPSPFVNVLGKKIPHLARIIKWWRERVGPLTSPPCQCGGFFQTTPAGEGSTSSDLQMCFFPARYNKGIAQRGCTFQCIAARPHSKGRVRLSGKTFANKPSIQGGYFTDKRDLASIREGIRLARTIALQPAFAKCIQAEISPGPELTTDSQLDEFILNNVHSAAAFAGTCRMCPFGQDGVCDTEFRVRGVRGVRVCDASVIPKLPGGQIIATTLMIAERAAEILLNPPARKAEGPAWPPMPPAPDPDVIDEMLHYDKQLRDALHAEMEAEMEKR